MRKRMRLFAGLTGIAAAVAAALVLPATISQAQSANVEKVTAADIGHDWYRADTRAPGTGTFVNGPATPPLGKGSFKLSTPVNTANVQLLTDEYDGVRLANLDRLSYSTYRDPTSTGFIAAVAALNLRVDTDGDGTTDSYVVYEPYQDLGIGAVVPGVWQSWDAIRGGAAKWWVNTVTNPKPCSQAAPCTWSTLLASYPNARIREATTPCPKSDTPTTVCRGSLGVNQGSSNPGIISYVDALAVSVKGHLTTYNFEPASSDDHNDGHDGHERDNGDKGGKGDKSDKSDKSDKGERS